MIRAGDFSLSRRGLFLGAAAAGVAANLLPNPASAKAPQINKQAPYYYRFSMGSIEATVISDGSFAVTPKLFSGVPQPEVERMLTDHFLPSDNVAVEQNILVLNTGEKLIVFDTGLGSAKLFGPGSGRMLVSLKEAGIDPKDVDAIVVSHAHPDHLWGVMADDGKPNFPNAQIYISEADYDFWTDEAKLANKDMKGFIEGARKHLVPNRPRIVFMKDGQEILPGVQALAAPGHTIGHMMFMLTSGNKAFAVLADTTVHPVLMFETPRLEFGFDSDPKQAVATRVRVLDMLAEQRIPFIAYHFPWPGIGYAAKRGDGFVYHPKPLQMVL
jgi:glyoxylase-like metal-dependent hydrolase (beta-lactamase superfamily II)